MKMNNYKPRSEDYHEGFAVGFDKAVRKILEVMDARADMFKESVNYIAMEAIERAMQDVKEKFLWTI
jgi:hypothetical protein